MANLNPLDFGAVGNDWTLDTTAFKNMALAMDPIQNNRIEIPALPNGKAYRIEEPIMLQGAHTFVEAGGARFFTKNCEDYAFKAIDLTNFNWNGGFFSGGNANNTGAIEVGLGSRCEISNVYGTSLKKAVVKNYQREAAVFHRVDGYNVGMGIHIADHPDGNLGNPQAISIDSCYISNFTDGGIYFDDLFNHVEIHNSTFTKKNAIVAKTGRRRVLPDNTTQGVNSRLLKISMCQFEGVGTGANDFAIVITQKHTYKAKLLIIEFCDINPNTKLMKAENVETMKVEGVSSTNLPNGWLTLYPPSSSTYKYSLLESGASGKIVTL